MKTVPTSLKGSLLIALLTLITGSSFGQEEKPDTTKLRFGNVKILIIEDENPKSDSKFEYTAENDSLDTDDEDEMEEVKHWAGLDLGINGYLTASQSTGLPKEINYLELDYGRSISWSLNPFEKNFKIYKNYVGLVTGLGLEFNRYAFKNNYTLNVSGDSLIGVPSALKFEKNILKATYLTAPLLLGFSTNQDKEKAFHVAIGLVGGYKIGSKLKQVYDKDGTRLVNKFKDDFNLAPFKYSATARIGYGKFNLFATYALSDMFDDKSLPALSPFTAGITLVGF